MSEEPTSSSIGQTSDEGLIAVRSNQVTTLEEYFEKGFKIADPQVVDLLLPRLREELIALSPVQKQTDAGERTRMRTIVVIGDENGHVGVGVGKASQVSDSIAKASRRAKLGMISVRRGCGSWECRCGESHSLPFTVKSRAGSVGIELIPAPKGTGLVTGDKVRVVLSLAGIRDAWSRSDGSTTTYISAAFAAFNALKQTYITPTTGDWGAL